MTTDEIVRSRLIAIHRKRIELEGGADRLVLGGEVEIVETFRDQPHGNSKPDLKGQRFKIDGAGICFSGDGICIWLEGVNCAIPISKVRFL